MGKNVGILKEWQNKTLDEILPLCRELIEDPEFYTVKRWREKGGKVVGHFQVYFPEEIVHAAGLLPLRICGAQVKGMEGESHFGSYLCSIIKTSLEIALTKKIEMEMFVSHPICDAARNLAAIWGRNFPYKCQILYLPQNPNSIQSVEYLRHEYDRLKRDVETISGEIITNEALQYSINVYNESRKLVKELYTIKNKTPWLIAAEDAYALVALGGLIPRDEYNEILHMVLPEIKDRKFKKQDRMRVVFEGGFCEQPPLDLIQLIGRSCYLVDDDLLIGARWIKEPILTEGDALYNLAYAYIEQSSYSPVQHDVRKLKEKLLIERIRGANADAAIVTSAKMCEPGLEEQVAYANHLEKESIPFFLTEFEENQTSFEQLGIQLETFVENQIFC